MLSLSSANPSAAMNDRKYSGFREIENGPVVQSSLLLRPLRYADAQIRPSVAGTISAKLSQSNSSETTRDRAGGSLSSAIASNPRTISAETQRRAFSNGVRGMNVPAATRHGRYLTLSLVIRQLSLVASALRRRVATSGQ